MEGSPEFLCLVLHSCLGAAMRCVRACVRLPGSGRLRMGVVGGREVGMEIGLWAGWMGWDGMWGTLCGG